MDEGCGYRLWRAGSTLAAAVAIGICFAGPALAQDTGSRTLDNSDQIVLNGRLVVPAEVTVGAAVIFNGSAIIDGTVQKTLVVFHGDAEIFGTVRGDVVVFDGRVIVRSGAEIDGNIVSRQTPLVEKGATVRGQQQRVATRFDVVGFGLASRIAWWIGYSISTLILGLLLLAFAPASDGAIARAARERMGGSIGIGIASFFLIPIGALLFLATVVAIPLGLFVLLALALLYTVGYVAGSHTIGRFLLKPPASRYGAFLAGWGILRVLALIPILGGIVWTLASVLGLGILAVAARRSPPAHVPEAPAMPPPMPTPP